MELVHSVRNWNSLEIICCNEVAWPAGGDDDTLFIGSSGETRKQKYTIYSKNMKFYLN